MPVSENTLRDLLHERSTAVPPTPDLADRVQVRVRRRRRLEAGTGIAALVMVLLAAGLVFVPRHDATPPVSAPTHRSTQMMESTLRVTTEGPTRIEGEVPVDATLEITNTGSTTWRGVAGVGLASPGEVPGYVGLNQLLASAGDVGDPMITQGPDAVADRSSAQEFAGQSVGTVVLAPGEHRSWTVRVKRNASSSVLGPVYGWIPYVDRDSTSDETVLGSLDRATRIVVTPLASDRACDTVTVTSAKVGPAGPWTLVEARRAVVGTDLAATWLPLDVPDAPITRADVALGDARETTVMLAVSAYLAGTATPVPATGYPSGDNPADAREPVPGTYIWFAGSRLVDVSFTGTCGPSGQEISGTWTAYYRTMEGLLDCSVVPSAGTLAVDAKRFCKL